MFLGWGGGYTDEPLSKILQSLQHAEVINMDRWRLRLSLNTETTVKISEKVTNQNTILTNKN